MSTGLAVGVVIAAVLVLVVALGRVADLVMRSVFSGSSTRPDPTMSAFLALVLRFFAVLALCIALVVRGGDDRVPLVYAAGATYFAAILVEAWRTLRKMRSRTANVGEPTGEIDPSGNASTKG